MIGCHSDRLMVPAPELKGEGSQRRIVAGSNRMVRVVSTARLPLPIREMFGDYSLVPNFEHAQMIYDDGSLMGYVVTSMSIDGKMMNSNVVYEGGEFHIDDMHESVWSPPPPVEASTDYPVCFDCLREIANIAYLLNGKQRDRPNPRIDDAHAMAVEQGLLCGGDHCDDPVVEE